MKDICSELKDNDRLIVQGCCEECNQWLVFTHQTFPQTIKDARGKTLCWKCLIKKKWRWLKRNISVKDYNIVMNLKMRAEGGFIPDKEKR